MTVESFSQGKNKDRNEDFFGSGASCFVLADGATDKSGREYGGKTGGELVSRLVVNEVLASSLNGAALVHHLNTKIKSLYEALEISQDVLDPKYRFSCCFVAVRIVGDKLIITYVGDTALRVNGQKIYRDQKQIDTDIAEARSQYIQATGDVAGSREHIMPQLINQYRYQNNPDDPLGYGVIDGSNTPDKFVHSLTLARNEVNTIELFSDGYFSIPSKTTISGWEEAFERAEQEDPDKWKIYKATKSKDDRTIAIIDFNTI